MISSPPATSGVDNPGDYRSETDATLRRTVETLAAWPSRNTNLPACAEAAGWFADELASVPGMRVETLWFDLPEGPRVPRSIPAPIVIGTLPGTSGRAVALSAHLDTFSFDGIEAPAPGADDDASGVAVLLDTARRLADAPRLNDLRFIAFSGEEQGLLGAKWLAARAREEGWRLDALLNFDMVGVSAPGRGGAVRLFSAEGPPREVARWIEFATRGTGFGVRLILRPDRIRRGGDHTPFANLGFPAVRFTSLHEAFERQHTALDLPEHVDYDYLARVADVATVAAGVLAAAGPPPRAVRHDGRQGHTTTLEWEGEGDHWTVYRRPSARTEWATLTSVTGRRVEIPANKDDEEFAVGAIGGVPVPVA